MVGEHIKWYTPAQKRDETAQNLLDSLIRYEF